VAARAAELSVRASPRFLFNHTVRTYAWGCMLAEAEGVGFDRELYLVASLLHDLGLTEAHDGPRCFEHESAAAAAAFARGAGWDGPRVEALAEAIRLHMQGRVILEDGPEAYLLTEATSCDVGGHRFDALEPARRARVLALAPREGFKAGFTRLVEDQARRKPGCMADLWLRRGLAARIAAAPFDG
jgi:HD domain